MGRSSDLSLNGNLRYPNDKDRSLNEAAADKILKYRADYNNNPPQAVAFMPAIASTSGRLHSEFIRLLFLQAHRETDRFFAASGVQPAQSTSGGLFHFKRAAFHSQLRSKVGSTLAKAAALRVNLNISHKYLIFILSSLRAPISTYSFCLSQYRHPKTRLIDEMFVSEMGEYVFLM